MGINFEAILTLCYLVISDIHFGHRRTTTAEIITHLEHYLENLVVENKQPLSVIFIAGDIFDRLFDGSDEALFDVTKFAFRFFRFCERHGICVRILEGTPSHDRRQSKLFEVVHQQAGFNCGFRYIDKVEVEILPALGKRRILYVPDRPTIKAEDTVKEIHKVVQEAGMDGADIAIMHGMFAYQCPQAPGNVEKYSELELMNIVREYIHIGHVHSFSSYERILAQGSFDRLAHNEEEAKGGVLVSLGNTPEANRWYFIENKQAKLYKTIKLKGDDVEKALVQIEKATKGFPQGSYIRLQAKKTHPLLQAFDQLAVSFPYFIFTKAKEDEVDTPHYLLNDVNVSQEESYTPIQLDKQNIVTMLMNEVTRRHSLTFEKTERLQQLLEREL